MLTETTMAKSRPLALFLFLLGACGGASEPSPAEPGPATPAGSTRFAGSYEVPVASELTRAATFDVPEIDWTVTGSTATLSYKLPRALVGKSVNVEFTGPIGADGRGRLTGNAGTAECTVTSGTVSCFETMRGLLPLEPDLDVVLDLAKASYPGPAEERIKVAKQFGIDPIGIAKIDLARPVGAADDDGQKQRGRHD